MAKYKDSIDLYDDEGKLLKSNVTIDKISPLVNKGYRRHHRPYQEDRSSQLCRYRGRTQDR